MLLENCWRQVWSGETWVAMPAAAIGVCLRGLPSSMHPTTTKISCLHCVQIQAVWLPWVPFPAVVFPMQISI